MHTDGDSLFEAFLNQHDETAWNGIIADLLPDIHEVDRTATRIWFAFYPLALSQALHEVADRELLVRKLLLQGRYRLSEQIDSSHAFLFGHRYWPEIKRSVLRAVTDRNPPPSLDLAELIREVASDACGGLKVASALTLGITAVGFMTIQQAGVAGMRASPGEIRIDPRRMAMSPDQVCRARARDKSQGLFGFLRGERKEFRVTFNENDDRAGFPLINTQHLTTAAALDKRPHHTIESRCTPEEGPIPVQCRSASCGTCWVGVLGGAEKLSEVATLERDRIREFGYILTDKPKPFIRLACQAQAFGSVSVVIPPWNGVFGKLLRPRGAPHEKTP
ncbi:MAG: (2Fe-2S)-binding protein [Acidobacteria bacterium]|nr:(2Fe-2S)-binding protein [Acidobacteriota bacterium]